MNSTGFLTLCRDCLQSIAELDDVAVKEEELFEHVIKWVEAECLRQKLEISSWENKRKVLGDVLFNIRFPLMDQEYFAQNVGLTELLTSDEKVDVLLYHTSKNKLTPKIFQCKMRNRCVVVGDFDPLTSNAYGRHGYTAGPFHFSFK